MLIKITILMMLMINSERAIYKFDKKSKLENWIILNDVVMGGQSIGSFELNDKGHGIFKGRVSLENNGGFASLMYRFENQDIRNYSSIHIRLKGDGLRYQFRVKSEVYDRQSYVHNFQTSGGWEWIEIPLDDMYPSWRGRKLNMPNYPGQTLEEISFLIGNNKAEAFQIELEQIILK